MNCINRLLVLAKNKLLYWELPTGILNFWVCDSHFIFRICRAGYIYSLNTAANFAEMIGESGQEYRNKANEILEATKPHYGKFGNYIYECDVRPEDGAVIHSIATFGEHF